MTKPNGDLGAKIVRLRKELGLSQEQLAGSEMSRSFISLVERNICRPSLPLLKILAQRLQKPIEYFLEIGSLSLSLEIVLHLVRHAERALEKSDHQAAQEHASLALKSCASMDEPELESRAYWVIASCLRKDGDLQGATEALEWALEGHTKVGDKVRMCRVSLELGHCTFRQEDFRASERYYRKAIALSERIKSLHAEHVHAITYLASCLTKVGRIDDAVTYYTLAMSEIDQRVNGWLWAMVVMSLGWVYQDQGQMEQAWALTLEARDMLAKLEHPDRFLAEHNLAILLMANGEVEQALKELNNCRAHYRKTKQKTREASATEDIIKCYLQMGELSKAKAESDFAISLIDGSENRILCGRLYALQAQIAKLENNHQQAAQLLEVAAALFRQVRASKELKEVMSHLSIRECMTDESEEGVSM